MTKLSYSPLHYNGKDYIQRFCDQLPLRNNCIHWLDTRMCIRTFALNMCSILKNSNHSKEIFTSVEDPASINIVPADQFIL